MNMNHSVEGLQHFQAIQEFEIVVTVKSIRDVIAPRNAKLELWMASTSPVQSSRAIEMEPAIKFRLLLRSSLISNCGKSPKKLSPLAIQTTVSGKGLCEPNRVFQGNGKQLQGIERGVCVKSIWRKHF